MAPSSCTGTPESGVVRVRAHLLTALHVGRLTPGDRIPSVRRLADITGINRKTVHRAYTELAREGLLEVKPGSGTFVAERHSGVSGDNSSDQLTSVLERSRGEASLLGLSPERFVAFLAACFTGGLRGLPVSICECNWEQLGMLGRDLGAQLELAPRPVPLRQLLRDPAAATRGSRCVITTDCHFSQVVDAVEPFGVPVYVVSLDQEFPRLVARFANRWDLLLVVRDASFGPVFMRLLTQLGVSADALARVRFVDLRRADSALRDATDETYVHLSPLVADELRGRVPARLRRLRAQWAVSAGSLERLRASLALDVTLRPPGEPAEPRSSSVSAG